jgi:hypothetical protein
MRLLDFARCSAAAAAGSPKRPAAPQGRVVKEEEEGRRGTSARLSNSFDVSPANPVSVPPRFAAGRPANLQFADARGATLTSGMLANLLHKHKDARVVLLRNVVTPHIFLPTSRCPHAPSEWTFSKPSPPYAPPKRAQLEQVEAALGGPPQEGVLVHASTCVVVVVVCAHHAFAGTRRQRA